MFTYKEKIKSYSKHMTILNLIKTWLFCCGHYVVTITAKPLIYVHKVFCIVFAGVVAETIFVKGNVSFFILGIEYILSVTLSLMFGHEYLSRFYRAIKINDVMMGIKKESIFDDVIRIILFIFLTVRISLTCLEIYFQSGFEYQMSCVCITVVSSNMICMIISIILYTCYVRMRLLRRRFEEITIPVNIINEVGAMCKVREVRRCLQHYHNLLDIMKDIDREFKYLVNIFKPSRFL
ncbi:hypothetical protein O3G_MSEX002910 [Manduca sexta]|uniref:Uncharacterized protein n=1 Tax=Manduca sexta TaxID=7130 RepID=A0A921YQF6_MANSE|nr:hypothetical protein O3G_MSEX002910 [Manduca sexta]